MFVHSNCPIEDGVCILVPGYAIGTIIGQKGVQLKQLREHQGVHISLKNLDKEETFAGQRSHQMELHISGTPVAVEDVKRRVEILIDRAGALHKPPHEQVVLVDVAHAGCARLVQAGLDDFHVCPIELRNTNTGSNPKYFVLQNISDASEAEVKSSDSRYVYSANRHNWESLVRDFRKFQSDTPPEKLSGARVSVRFGQLFFWGPRLSKEDAQKPGAINQLNYRDCRGQFAARLKSVVGKNFTEILQKSQFERFQFLSNKIITFYIKPEGDGEKREITFNDPKITAERRAEIARLWTCTSHKQVLQLGEEVRSSRVELASRALRHLLHPSQNEFAGCEDAMKMIQQASDGLLSHPPKPCRCMTALCQLDPVVL